MKVKKKLEAPLGSVSLACSSDSDCWHGAMNDFFSRSLTSRHTPLSERLEQPRPQGSLPLGPRKVGEDPGNKVAPGRGYDFQKVPLAFWARKQTFKSKSLLTGSFIILNYWNLSCSGLLIIGIFQKHAPGARFSKVWVDFRARKAVYVCYICIPDRSFKNFKNDTMKLSVNKAKLTGF